MINHRGSLGALIFTAAAFAAQDNRRLGIKQPNQRVLPSVPDSAQKAAITAAEAKRQRRAARNLRNAGLGVAA